MLLVFASIADQRVSTGVAHWRSLGVTADVVTTHDLAQPGWTLTLDDEPTLVVDGKRVAARAVTAIVNRLSYVTEFEVPFVDAADRAYAASEMQGFLVALLEAMKCPLLNRPSPGNLCGPSWVHEQWVLCAAQAGVAVRPAVRKVYAGGATAPTTIDPPVLVHVVGTEAFGDGSPSQHQAAVAIAKAAGTDLLRVAFDPGTARPTFVGADPWVDVSQITIADAIRRKVSP